MDIRLDGVTYDYPGGIRALEGVDLVIPSGQAVALVGANGSGKTTLAQHLDGLLRPTRGRVLIGDIDTSQAHVAHLARSVALSFQHPDHQIFSSDVISEVAFGPRHLARDEAQVREDVDAALEAVGLQGARLAHPDDLGDSRRKLLTIAGVLAMCTPVVVLDEPTTGLDGHGVATVAKVVAGLRAEGRTVVGISHDLRFVAETFERVVVLAAGRIVLDGTPVEVFGEDAWPQLRSAGLEPPVAAMLGARLGLGSTPTEESLVAALVAASREALHPGDRGGRST